MDLMRFREIVSYVMFIPAWIIGAAAYATGMWLILFFGTFGAYLYFFAYLGDMFLGLFFGLDASRGWGGFLSWFWLFLVSLLWPWKG